MGWLSNLLLPGRLRTGPTVLLPTRPDPATMLAIAQLADPDAVVDGADVLVGGSRIAAAVELTGTILAKLGVGDEERLWACRVSAEGPLPIDMFDKSLAEGIAYRLGGWSLCQGTPVDPAEGEPSKLCVYLPATPTRDEIVPVLAECLRPVASLDSERWPDGELVDGIVRVPAAGGGDVYLGADTMVTFAEGQRIPPAARIRWPYLTEIVVATIAPLNSIAVGDAEESAAPADTDTPPEPPAPAADDEQRLLNRAAVALVLARRLQGIAGDQWGFQFSEPADVLPGRHERTRSSTR